MQLHLHKHMTNQEIADVFDFIGGVLELQGANRFRSRAYDNAATAISQLDKQLNDMWLSDPDFDKIPGVGETLQQKLTELFTTGGIKAFQEYVKDIPIGVFTLFTVHGIGVKKAYKIASHFDLESEEKALNNTLMLAKAGKIRELEGFGAKSEQDLITAIEHHHKSDRIPYKKAIQVAKALEEELITCKDIQRVEVLGSLRRHSETVGDIDLGIAVTTIGPVKNFVKNMKSVKRMVVSGEQLLRVQTTDNWQVDIKVSPLAEWGSFLQHFTGSKEHNIRLREYAQKQGLSLSEHGIRIAGERENGKIGELITFDDETNFYNYLGFDWIPPQERLRTDELERYKNDTITTKSI